MPPELRDAVASALDGAGVGDGHLAVELVGADRIRELNREHRGKDVPTDVLAFPMDELRPGRVNEDPEEGVLGDLVICPEVAQRQGETAGHGRDAEIELLTVHGILHLLGYDHAEPQEKADMFALKDKILAAWVALRTTSGNVR